MACCYPGWGKAEGCVSCARTFEAISVEKSISDRSRSYGFVSWQARAWSTFQNLDSTKLEIEYRYQIFKNWRNC
jgi:hypothetical protein